MGLHGKDGTDIWVLFTEMITETVASGGSTDTFNPPHRLPAEDRLYICETPRRN